MTTTAERLRNMARILRRFDSKRECELLGDPHSHKRPAALAMRRAMDRLAPQVAQRTGMSPRTVETWQEPAAPQWTPIDRLLAIVETARANGRAEVDAIAPVAYLALQLGYLLAPNRRDLDAVSLISEAERIGGRVLKEAGEAVADLIVITSDARVTRTERERGIRSLEEIELVAREAIQLLRMAPAGGGRKVRA